MKVVLPINDEHFGEAIVEHVIKHRWPDEDTAFKLVHVLEWEPSATEMASSPPLENYAHEQRKNAESLLAKFEAAIEQALPQAIVEHEIRAGRPAEQIIAASKDWEADQIVMGSHGRHGVELFLIGSVSNAVVTHTDCSVTVVRQAS